MAYKQRRKELHSSVKIVDVSDDASWRRNRQMHIMFHGITKTAWEWSKEKEMNYGTILARAHAGWSAHEIFGTPVKTREYDKRGRKVIRNNPRSSYECIPRKIPKNVHPVMKEILLAMKKQCMSHEQMHQRSGVSYSSQQQHKHGHMGLFTNVEAMANVVGLEIVTIKKKKSK